MGNILEKSTVSISFTKYHFKYFHNHSPRIQCSFLFVKKIERIVHATGFLS